MDLTAIRKFDQLSDDDLFDYQTTNDEIRIDRDTDDLESAYRGAMANYKLNPNEYTRSPLCFVLLDFMKTLESKETFADWQFFLDKVLALDFDLSADRFAKYPFDRTVRNTSKAVGAKTFNQALQSEATKYHWFAQFVNKVENSMSPKEVFDLFRAGNLNQAYPAAVKNYAEEPNNEFVRNTLCSIYLEYLEASRNDPEAVKKCLDQILAMHFDLIPVKFVGNIFKSKLRKVIGTIGAARFESEMADEMQQYPWFKKTVEDVQDNVDSQLVTELWKGFNHNSLSLDEIIAKLSPLKQYQDKFLSLLIVKLVNQANNQQVLKLVHNLGWNCYQREDYFPSHYKDKQTGEEKQGKPLIMNVFAKYKDALLELPPAPENNQLIKDFVDEIDTIVDKTNNTYTYEYTYYYKAKLQGKIGDYQGGTKSILRFLMDNPKHYGDYWCWDKLGDFAQASADKVALYCRALLCKTPAENLLKIHGKLSRLFEEQQSFKLASAEINVTNELNQINNNARIAQYLEQHRQNDWYEADAKPDKAVYEKYAALSDQYIYSDVPEAKIYVNNVNSAKSMVNCVFTNNHIGFFKCPKDVDINSLKADAYYNAQLVIDDRDYNNHTSVAFPDEAHYKCIRISPAKDDRKDHAVSARLIKRAGNDYAFTDTDEFVGKQFIKQYDLVDKSSDKTGSHYIEIEGLARDGWNAKKRQWTPEIFKITNIESHE